MLFQDYKREEFFDELFKENNKPRNGAKLFTQKINLLSKEELVSRQDAADRAMLNMGITFNVYGEGDGAEKIFPFDVIPRIIGKKEWSTIEQGLKQRIYALNLFLDDIYHDQKIVKEGIIPKEVIRSAESFQKACVGLNPPKGIWCHITGTDLVRDRDGQIYVLEDNMRCPSGVSYVLQNREIMKQVFPQIFEQARVAPVELYPNRLLETLHQLAPEGVYDPMIVLLTPGTYNSAYFEHSFLAQQMGIQLVEGSDLVVKDGFVQMRTTQGFQKVDVIYRRINDDFIDPLVFRKDSILGVSGLMDVYRNGKVAIANAMGTGVADDKVIYAYVPEMIRFYLGEDIKLPNVPTFPCWDEKNRNHVLGNLDKMVVKSANEAGGYGMLIGPKSTKKEREHFRGLIQADPRNYIGQPTLSLSRVPTLIKDKLEGRHVDLRPYILYGEDIYVLPGGLTRVALKKGSLVVNSSQGGGSKDTWVL